MVFQINNPNECITLQTNVRIADLCVTLTQCVGNCINKKGGREFSTRAGTHTILFSSTKLLFCILKNSHYDYLCYQKSLRHACNAKRILLSLERLMIIATGIIKHYIYPVSTKGTQSDDCKACNSQLLSTGLGDGVPPEFLRVVLA